MRKLFIIILVSTSIFANEFKIDSIDKDIAKIECENIKTGQSGLVLREVDTIKTIIAEGEIVSKNSDNCEFKISEFNSLQQSALPKITEKPQNGDTIIFNSLSDRAVVIAPNAKEYKNFILDKKEISEETFIHPDIFSTYLMKQNNPSPTKESFKTFCSIFSIGKVYFVLDKSYEVDCFSLKILSESDLELIDKSEIKPFFSRVGELEESFWSFNNKMSSYFSYYKKLLNLEK